MRCANCGNDDFDPLTVRHFTVHCSVCGHNTFTATGLDTRKARNAVIVIAVLAFLAYGIWTLKDVSFERLGLRRWF